MKLIEMKCKNCGSNLKLNPEEKEITCKYCNTTFKIDDEVKHIKYDDMFQSGYEFERGRIRAQKENKYESNFSNTNNISKKNYKTLLLILAWICLLPFTATYFIIKSNKLNTGKKVLIIIAVWVAFFLIGWIADTENTKDKKNKIITCYSEEVYDKLDKLIGIKNIYGSFSSNDCNNLNLEDKDKRKITIEVDSLNSLKAIKVDNKYIYNIN